MNDSEIRLPSGHMSSAHMEAMLQAVPVEMTFVDENDENRYFSRGNKGFARNLSALDKSVYSCHAPASQPKVREIIEAFRAGEKDSVEYWLEKKDKTLFIRYIAVRDEEGTYLGTLECVQDMGFALDYLKEKMK